MYDELTEIDIKKMKEEIAYRIQVLRPQLIADVQTARAFGDLSENFEYKCAKQEKNRNESRIRYLERMVRTAKVITDTSSEDTIGLYDKIVVFNEKLQKEMSLQIVTTLRQDALRGAISKESPVGKALLAAAQASASTSKPAKPWSTIWSSDPSKRGRTTAPSPSARIEEEPL